MPSMVLAGSGSGIEELMLRLGRVQHRIADADYIGAMQSLRYWDRGYDLGPLPRQLLDALDGHSRAARVCLASGQTAEAADHVRRAVALAAATCTPVPAPPSPRAPRRRRQSANSPS